MGAAALRDHRPFAGRAAGRRGVIPGVERAGRPGPGVTPSPGLISASPVRRGAGRVGFIDDRSRYLVSGNPATSSQTAMLMMWPQDL